MGLLLLPAWAVVMLVVLFAEIEIYDRASRPEAYRRQDDGTGGAMGCFVWAVGIIAFPVTIVVYLIGSSVGSAKQSG